MSDFHPDSDTLARYSRGELGQVPRRDLEQHLAGCPVCQERVDALPAPAAPAGTVRWQGHRFAARRAAHERETERQENLDGVLEALGPIVASLSRGELGELLGADDLRRRALIRDEPRFRSLALSGLLQARCRAAWPDDPQEAVESAKLAVLVAERLAADGGGEAAEKARAMALMHLGEAFRVAAEERQRPAGLVADAAEGAGQTVGERRSWTAEQALWDLRDAFLDRGMGFDAVLVCLDLAAMLLEQGREGDLQRMAATSIERFTEKGADPYVIDALRFLLDPGRREGRPLTLALIAQMARFLDEARHDPRR